MNKKLRLMLCSIGLLMACITHASPLEQAQEKSRATFDWPASELSDADQTRVNKPWPNYHANQERFTFTFEQIKEKWPELMRGMKIEYPSASYLKTRYEMFPGLLQSLAYPDDNWEMHSANVLEVWQAFFRGDFQHASELGRHYGGYAEVPGVLSEIIAAIYTMKSLEDKQALLRDAILRIHRYGQMFPYVAGDEPYTRDYAMLRLGFAYAVGRLAEDEPVPALLTNKHPIIAMNTVTELLAVMPEHPMGLALAGGVDANVIRRVGKLVGGVGLDASAFDAERAFVKAINLVPDMAILRYEHANSLLYSQGRKAWGEVERELVEATKQQPQHVMEALDNAYAQKHLTRLREWATSKASYKKYDASQRKQRNKNDINGYYIDNDALLASQ